MNPKPTLVAVAFLVALFAAPGTRGDSVKLKCKRRIEGRLVEKKDGNIIIETFRGTMTIPKKRVSKHTEKKSAFEKYEEKIEDLKDTADGQVKLGKMCEKGYGFDLARTHYKKALELDPENKTAKRLIEGLDKKKRRFRRKFPAPKGLTIDVAIVQDLSREEIEKIGEVLQKASRRLSEMTDKEYYIAEGIFNNKTPKGFFIYDKNFKGTPPGPPNCYMAPQNWWVPVIIHEIAQVHLRLRNEKNPPEPCNMAHDWKAGFCSRCRKKMRIGWKYAKFLQEEIPDPPEMKITIRGVKDKKKKPDK